jgi:anti-sigma regulatory factor (Ser/Thr protein kinase)
MKSEIDAAASARCSTPEAQVEPSDRSFTVQLSSTRRGARLARLLTVQRLDDWGIPYSSALSHTAALITAELAANAVRHCGRTGRDFRLRLLLDPARVLRIEVTDACADRPLPHGRWRTVTGEADLSGAADPMAEGGYGLILVDALAARWGSTVNDLVTKTVWAELADGPREPDRLNNPLYRAL